MTDYLLYGSTWTGTSSTGTKRIFQPYASFGISEWDTGMAVSVYSLGIRKQSNAECYANAPLWCNLTANLGIYSGANPVQASLSDWSYKEGKDINKALTIKTSSVMYFSKTTYDQTLTLTLSGGKSSGVYLGSCSKVILSLTIPALASYPVTFNANGGTGAPPNSVKWQSSTYGIPSTVPTRHNHTFLYWVSNSGTIYYPGSSYTGNAPLNLTAAWALQDGWLDGEMWVKTESGWKRGTQAYKKEDDVWKPITPYIKR